MSIPETDPTEQANISGADFAIMCDILEALTKENEALKARLAELDKQEAVAEFHTSIGNYGVIQYLIHTGEPLKFGDKFYTAPKPSPTTQAAVAMALQKAASICRSHVWREEYRAAGNDMADAILANPHDDSGIKKLVEALREAITIIGHPDDAITIYLKSVLKEFEEGK